MRIYLCFFSILISLQVSAQQTITKNSDSLAQIKREHYSLSYPRSWAVDTSKMFGMDLFLLSPRVDSLDQFSENLNVFVQYQYIQIIYQLHIHQINEKEDRRDPCNQVFHSILLKGVPPPW